MNLKLISAGLILIGLACLSCEKSDSSAARNTVIQDGSNVFEELSMLINLKSSDSSYVLVEKIDSVKLKVGDFFEVKTSSGSVDTTIFNSYPSGDFNVTGQKVNYLVLARPSLEPQDFSTAGEYADYLNKLLELKTGEYVCLLESIWISLADGTKRQYFPHVYTTFTVFEGAVTAYAGEITIEI